MVAEQVHEELKTLASGLKAEREARGFSLKDVHEKTRISVTILDAIEKGEFHLLPPGVYRRNFIRSYAEFLKVDCQPILDSFQEESEHTAPPVLQKEALGTFPSSEQRSWKYSAAVLSIFLLVGILVWFLAPYVDKSVILSSAGSKEKEKTLSNGEIASGAGMAVTGGQTPTDSTKALPAIPNAVTPQVAEPVPAQVPPSLQTGEKSGAYTLIIEAKEKTWLRIRTDDEDVTERTMMPGERMDLSARERFTLDIGNAAGVRVLFQDRLLENLGGQGQVVHLSLP